MKYIKYLFLFLIAFILGNLISPLFGFGCLSTFIYPPVCSTFFPYDMWAIVIVIFLLEIWISISVERNKLKNPKIYRVFKKLFLVMSFIITFGIQYIILNLLFRLLLPGFGCISKFATFNSPQICPAFPNIVLIPFLCLILVTTAVIFYKILKRK